MSSAPLIDRVGKPVNVSAYVTQMASRLPHETAVVVAQGTDRAGHGTYVHYTFAQLDRESDRLARGLVQVGVVRGTRAVLMVKPSLEFFALTFALLKVGAIPVLVDPGMGISNLGACLDQAEPDAFIGIPKAHAARVLFGWARRHLKLRISVGRFPGVDYSLADIARLGGDRKYDAASTSRDDIAAILFTSGSTGPPKGAIYTHGTFAAQVEILRTAFGIEPGETDLGTFPLFALFGPALGMSVVVPDMDASRPGSADPRRLIQAIEDFGCTNMFGSPALIDRLSRYGVEHGVRLTSLRRVFSAGAPASIPVLERFTRMLPEDTPIHTPYGATESLPVACIDSHTILGETRPDTEAGKGVCVGTPVGPMTVRVIRITDDPIEQWTDDLELPDGTVGELVVEGPVVTREYVNRPESNALAKIRHGNAVLHRMGDVGYRDEHGRLWFCGRKAHRVETPDGTLFTIPCESVFNTLKGVRRTALVGVSGATGTHAVLCVERDPASGVSWDQLLPRLKKRATEHPHTASIQTFVEHRSFPVDIRHNAKIFREKLATWASRRAR